jgi:plasmid maintenance system antidote protein VapI
MSRPPSEYADRLRAEIRALLRVEGVTQRWLAGQVHLTASHVSDVLTGRHTLSIELAELMLAKLGRRLVFDTAPIKTTERKPQP